MRVIVTCGPGSAPIDQVRFISNFSTGELGALLAVELQQCGYEVLCLRSRLATYPMDDNIVTIPFSTNEELAAMLEQLAMEEHPVAIFHAAALCDYRVEKITTVDGRALSLGKIPTDIGPLQLTLQPSLKIVAQLRDYFPSSLLVGWKYEVVGTREEAVRKAGAQIEQCRLDASVANGPATQGQFDLIVRESLSVTHPFFTTDSKEQLVRFLARWLRDTLLQIR
jgi:phosphopantothenoylcysteine synthetase/decarboxylase